MSLVQLRSIRCRLVFAVVLCLVLTVACTGGTTGGTSPTQSPAASGVSLGGNLNIRLIGDWDTLDPSGDAIPANPGGQMIIYLYDRLTQNQPDGAVVPYLARSWKRPDPSTVVFDLRSDMTCQDGTALTATTVANSFSRLFKSRIAASVFPGGIPAITADDAARTVQFKWPKPNLDAFYGFGSPSSSVICPTGLANAGTLIEKPSGSGPYVLSSATHGGSALLRKNPAWKWGPAGLEAKDLPDSLTFIVVASDTTAANQLITRELDVARIMGPDVRRLESNGSLQRFTLASFKLTSLVMNATPGHPTADPEVRRAIMFAVDPKEWGQAAYEGRGVTGTSLYLKDAKCYEPATADLMPKPSLDMARQVLRSAGYVAGPDGKLAKDGKPLTLSVIGTPVQYAKGTEYIATRLTELGVNISLSDGERATWVARLRAGTWDVTTTERQGPNIPSDQLAFVAGPLPPAGVNTSFSSDPVLNALLEEGLNAPDETAACQVWSKFQMQQLRNYDLLPLASPTSDIFAQQKIAMIPGSHILGLRRVP